MVKVTIKCEYTLAEWHFEQVTVIIELWDLFNSNTYLSALFNWSGHGIAYLVELLIA